jgi:hypothetical protein
MLSEEEYRLPGFCEHLRGAGPESRSTRASGGGCALLAASGVDCKYLGVLRFSRICALCNWPSPRDKRSHQTPAGVIPGTVTLIEEPSQAKPLEGVRLELRKSPLDSAPLVTATDADGRYEFSNLPSGVTT